MNEEPKAITVQILGKEYRIVCSQEEQLELRSSAEQLDIKMREIRDSGKIIGADRIAVMAALNLIHELNQLQHHNLNLSEGLNHRLSNLREKIETALESTH